MFVCVFKEGLKVSRCQHSPERRPPASQPPFLPVVFGLELKDLCSLDDFKLEPIDFGTKLKAWRSGSQLRPFVLTVGSKSSGIK